MTEAVKRESRAPGRCSALWGAVLGLAIATSALAQTPPPSPYAPLDPLPLGPVLLTLPSPHVAAAHAWEVRFTHRFTEPVNSGVHSLGGLDGGASVGFGISYVPVRDLELSLIRTNTMDTIEAAAKYVVVQQAPAIPHSLTLRGGVDWRTEKNLNDRSSFFAQAIFARRLGARAELFALPTFVTNAGRASTGETSAALFRHAANVPIGAAFSVLPNLSVVGELTPANRDLPDGMRHDFGWAVGIKKALGGHHFEIVLTNSTATTVDEYTTTTVLGSPLRRGEVHLGFNIERQF